MFFGIISLILVIESSYQWCVTVQENITYYTSVGEQIRWRADSLISGNGLDYTLTPELNIMKYHPAFDQISSEAQHYGRQVKPGSITAYDIASSGAWTNKFAYLELDNKQNQYDKYYADGNDLQMDHVPEFIYKTKLTESNPIIDCFEIEYINPDLWIVDCRERDAIIPTKTMKNYFYLVNSTDTPTTDSRIEVANHKQYTSVKGSRIQYHVYQKNKGEEIVHNTQFNKNVTQRIISIQF